MDRGELLALIDRHPKMDAGAVPAEWVQVAEANYSMHGHGLVRNILAGVAPVIEAAEKRRILAVIDAFECPCGEPDCSGRDTLSALTALLGEEGTDGGE